MESLLFLLNSVAMVVMVVMGLLDEKRPRGSETSVFRFRDTAVTPKPDARLLQGRGR